MNVNRNSEQCSLLHDIGVIDFVIVEMTEYLDTHPTDMEAIDYLSHYVKLKKQAMKDYAEKFGPLSIQNVDKVGNQEWKWALQPCPWEGVY